VPKDYFEAVKWYRAAAEQGDFLGQYHMGLCHLHGTGTTKDIPEAYKWFRLAADHRLGPIKELRVLSSSMSQTQLDAAEALYREATNEARHSKTR
jgi:TPR repeat protein